MNRILVLMGLVFGRAANVSAFVSPIGHAHHPSFLQATSSHSDNNHHPSIKRRDNENPAPRHDPNHLYYVIMFPERDGVHTIQRQHTTSNVVLAFKSFWGCRQFASLLAAQGFMNPTTKPISSLELASFCDNLNVDVETVPRHVRLVPPSQTVRELGRNPREEGNALEQGLMYLQEEGLIENESGSWE